MDSFSDRLIGLCCLVVGFSVIFFASKLPLDPKSPIPLVRKIFGFTIAGALILYGLYSLIAG